MTHTIFSDGTIDTYKGKRDVKAGWQVILPNGKRIQGHSISVQTARKTARNTASQECPIFNPYASRGAVPAGYLRLKQQHAIEQGFKSIYKYEAWVKAAREDFVRSCLIEVVEVEA